MANKWEPRFKEGDCITYNKEKLCIKNVNLDNQTYNFVEGGTGTGDYIDNGYKPKPPPPGWEGGVVEAVPAAELITSTDSAAGGRKLRKSKKSRRSKKNRRSRRRTGKY